MIQLNNLFLYAAANKNNNFLMFMIILIVILLILIIVISYASKLKENKILEEKRKEYKKNFRKNIKVLNYDEDKEIDLKPSIKINSKKTENLNIPEEKVQNEVVEIKKEEIKPKKEEIEVIEVMDESIDDELESIKKSIENSNTSTIDLNKWEQEQEESAIISYDELVKKAGAKKIIYKTKKKAENKGEKIEPVDDKKFKPTKVLSPIYGTHNDIEKIDKQIDAFSRVERLKTNNEEEEMKNDIEFLNKLKKFRNELGIK